MYSSCPNIIRHFVPLKFSESLLDSKPPACYFTAPEYKQQTSPLKNLKLKCAKPNPKDFLLIFKNKSFKQYEAKKKVKYSQLIKLLKEKGELKNKIFHNLVFIDQPLSSSRNISSREYVSVGSRQSPTKQFIKLSGRAQTSEKSRNTDSNFLRMKTSQIKIRTASPAKDNFVKDAKQSVCCIAKECKTGRSNSTRPNSFPNKKVYSTNQRLSSGQADKLINFKIRGVKAPQEEIIEFFKKSKTDSNCI